MPKPNIPTLSSAYANAAPHSIAAALVGELLTGGATVIMTSSRVNDARLAFAKELYRTHANMDAALWVVPANMASFRDVDALISWVGSEQTETHGATTEVVKPALLPDLFVPFAAPRVSGTVGSDPQGALAQELLLLWSVERAIHLLAGLGALAAARGGRDSALSRALADLGLSADDIAVVSKHDTSTRANDPNEAELHSRLSAALGRSEGNPLYVVSQKTLTGHAKGGAALFQAAGLIDIFRRQEIPANRSLDCLDPDMAQWMPLLWLRKPLDVSASPVRAGVLTSLGFGHIAAIVVLAHPGAFEAALLAERGEAALAQWRERAQARLEEGRRHLDEAMIGRAQLFVPIEGRRLPADRTHEAEVALLLDPSARLGADGTYAGAEN